MDINKPFFWYLGWTAFLSPASPHKLLEPVYWSHHQWYFQPDNSWEIWANFHKNWTEPCTYRQIKNTQTKLSFWTNNFVFSSSWRFCNALTILNICKYWWILVNLTGLRDGSNIWIILGLNSIFVWWLSPLNRSEFSLFFLSFCKNEFRVSSLFINGPPFWLSALEHFPLDRSGRQLFVFPASVFGGLEVSSYSWLSLCVPECHIDTRPFHGSAVGGVTQGGVSMCYILPHSPHFKHKRKIAKVENIVGGHDRLLINGT